MQPELPQGGRMTDFAADFLEAMRYEHWLRFYFAEDAGSDGTDDGSEDDTLAIARKYQDKRIRIIADGTHRGIAARLNMMVRQSPTASPVRIAVSPERNLDVVRDRPRELDPDLEGFRVAPPDVKRHIRHHLRISIRGRWQRRHDERPSKQAERHKRNKDRQNDPHIEDIISYGQVVRQTATFHNRLLFSIIADSARTLTYRTCYDFSASKVFGEVPLKGLDEKFLPRSSVFSVVRRLPSGRTSSRPRDGSDSHP